MEATLPVGVDRFVANLRGQIDNVRHDVPILGSQDRAHPYIGHVNSNEFRLRKRVGLPWDHFSPKCSGTVEERDGQTVLRYSFDRRTRAWWIGWFFVCFSAVGVLALMVQAARDMVEETNVVANLPMALVASTLGFAGLCVFLTLKYASQNAQVDTAELDYLIRFSGDPPPTSQAEDMDADAAAAAG